LGLKTFVEGYNQGSRGALRNTKFQKSFAGGLIFRRLVQMSRDCLGKLLNGFSKFRYINLERGVN